MITQSVYIPLKRKSQDADGPRKGTYLVVLHVTRIPPHIGMMFDGRYTSLTIKGQEKDISVDTLLKMITQKKIPAYFIELTDHPVFSVEHQREMFLEDLSGFDQVKQNKATCLSPVKLFLRDFYALRTHSDTLFHELMQMAQENGFLKQFTAYHLPEEEGLTLPFYTPDELQAKIAEERKPFYND